MRALRISLVVLRAASNQLSPLNSCNHNTKTARQSEAAVQLRKQSNVLLRPLTRFLRTSQAERRGGTPDSLGRARNPKTANDDVLCKCTLQCTKVRLAYGCKLILVFLIRSFVRIVKVHRGLCSNDGQSRLDRRWQPPMFAIWSGFQVSRVWEPLLYAARSSLGGDARSGCTRRTVTHASSKLCLLQMVTRG